MIYAYCVRRAGEPAPDAELEGLAGRPVRLIEAAGIGAWISDTPALPPTPERLRDHDRVVRAALRTATPLPIRYGTGCFATESDARDALRARSDELRESLARVEGRLEMGVRLEWTRPEPSSEPRNEPSGRSPGEGDVDQPSGGRAYLEARRREIELRDAGRAAAAAALDRLERELDLEGVPTVRTLLPSPGVAGLLAHLVLRSEAQRYNECVTRAARAMPEYRLTVSGPWAPYSFS